MRSLVKHVFYDEDNQRNGTEFKVLKGEFDDPRVIEMYELAANSNNEKPWSEREPTTGFMNITTTLRRWIS